MTHQSFQLEEKIFTRKLGNVPGKLLHYLIIAYTENRHIGKLYRHEELGNGFFPVDIKKFEQINSFSRQDSEAAFKHLHGKNLFYVQVMNKLSTLCAQLNMEAIFYNFPDEELLRNVLKDPSNLDLFLDNRGYAHIHTRAKLDTNIPVLSTLSTSCTPSSFFKTLCPISSELSAYTDFPTSNVTEIPTLPKTRVPVEDLKFLRGRNPFYGWYKSFGKWKRVCRRTGEFLLDNTPERISSARDINARARAQEVYVTDSEHFDLLSKFGNEVVEHCYAHLSAYKQGKPEKKSSMDNDYFEILKWVVKDVMETLRVRNQYLEQKNKPNLPVNGPAKTLVEPEKVPPEYNPFKRSGNQNPQEGA